MKRRILGIAMAVVASLLCGCATFMQGGRQWVEVNSDPPGAMVMILPTGEEVETPARVSLRRDTSLTLFVEKPGYRAARVFVDREHNPWGGFLFNGNLILGGFFGMFVDHRSGALFRLASNPVEIVLEATPEAMLLNESLLDVPSNGRAPSAEADTPLRWLPRDPG